MAGFTYSSLKTAVQDYLDNTETTFVNNINNFIEECFIDGKYNQEHIYRKEASKKNCRFCEFNQTEYCDAGVK